MLFIEKGSYRTVANSCIPKSPKPGLACKRVSPCPTYVCVCVFSRSNSSKGTFKKLVDVFSTSWKTAPCPGLPRFVKFAKLKKVRFIRRMLLQVPDSSSSSGVATEPEMKKSCERKGGGGPGGRCKRSQEGQNFLKREREGKKREGASEEIGPGA